MQAAGTSLTLGPLTLDHFVILFVAGAMLRAVGIFWLARVREPGAWSWREMSRGKQSGATGKST
jgi:hypothetical protein